LPDGRPYFTMKLVQGQKLSDLLAAHNDPAPDRPRLLSIFLQVSQTLAYAHTQGVVHRDLKPSNVMVGAFGEVYVMDWGLAKVLADGYAAERGEAVQASTERSEVTHGTDDPAMATRPGSVKGTPAYMAPEQAQGEVVDKRSDVFGLGTILCEILTG